MTPSSGISISIGAKKKLPKLQIKVETPIDLKKSSPIPTLQIPDLSLDEVLGKIEREESKDKQLDPIQEQKPDPPKESKRSKFG